MKHIFWIIQAAIFYTLTLIAAYIPYSIAFRLGAQLGFIIPLIIPKRRKIVIDNINASLAYMKAHQLWNSPCKDAGGLARAIFMNMGRSLIEICKLYHGRGEAIIKGIQIRGLENYEAARTKGKGIIFLSGHCGNWELMSLTLSSLFGKELSGIVRSQNNPYFNKMVERMRSRYNSRLIYKKGAMKAILAALKKKEMVGIMADQAVFPNEGYLIDVLGRKAWAAKAPVIIARKSGAALVPVFIYREGEQHIITFYPEHVLDSDTDEAGIKKDTEALSRYVEDFIVAHPTQWYWVHRRWKRAESAS